MKELEILLGTEAFKALGCLSTIKVCQLMAVLSLLIKCGLPFDLTFDPPTRAKGSNAQLTVVFNPRTSMIFIFDFEP